MYYEFRLLLLPDRSGRKLVDDWGGTTRGSFPTDYDLAKCGIRQRLAIVGNDPCVVPCRVNVFCIFRDFVGFDGLLRYERRANGG